MDDWWHAGMQAVSQHHGRDTRVYGLLKLSFLMMNCLSMQYCGTSKGVLCRHTMKSTVPLVVFSSALLASKIGSNSFGLFATITTKLMVAYPFPSVGSYYYCPGCFNNREDQALRIRLRHL
jgi:hypothetical protein